MGANNDCALISESRTDNLFLMFRRGPGAKSAKREYAWRNCRRAPQPPQHFLSEARTRQPRLFFVLSGFGKSLRRFAVRFASPLHKMEERFPEPN